MVTPSTFNVRGDGVIDAEEVVRRTEELLPEVGDRVRVWCSIRQIMMVTEDLLLKLKDLCLSKGLGITYHLASTRVRSTMHSLGTAPGHLRSLIGWA
ncbi:hypothetical protein [Vulcanisaeta distributa]|uniref:hypothetical protein n=1 Tax=Vulcanisaeta distributa TaxID=164451 RepID=UPI000B1E1C56|nr:hypothetical protein [Vulcanisaeta distributa]